MKRIFLIASASLLMLASCQKKDYIVVIKTAYGDIRVILYDQTPKHKQNFLYLARTGQYDSTVFHRVIRNFMIQGGDVNAKPGMEDKIDYTIPAEFIDTLIHHRGALAAARLGDQQNPERASSGCQFYIVQGLVQSETELTTDMARLNQYLNRIGELPGYESMPDTLNAIYYSKGNEAYYQKILSLKPVLEEGFSINLSRNYPERRMKVYTTLGGTPHLDDAYTVFGRVVEGLEVVEKIAGVQTGQANRPVENIYIRMELEPISPKQLQKRYPSPF